MVSGVENQVLAHDGQTDETEISSGTKKTARGSADIDAGETGAIVSDRILVNSRVKASEILQGKGSPCDSEGCKSARFLQCANMREA